MAKEDFCFTYYDGDAARDKAHMNRLERGGYDDLITSQRKFGHLSLALIKKTLGSDFDTIWESIRIILNTDAEGKFYIEWLENSIQKMRRQSIKQSNNGSKGGRPKAKQKPTENPNKSQTISQEKPLGNENGNVDENVDETIEGGVGETNFSGIVPEMVAQFVLANELYPVEQEVDFPSVRMIAEKILKWDKLPGIITDLKNSETVKRRWGELIVFIKSDPHYSGYSLTRINKHFQSIAQSFNNGSTAANRSNFTGGGKKPGTSEARINRAREW